MPEREAQIKTAQERLCSLSPSCFFVMDYANMKLFSAASLFHTADMVKQKLNCVPVQGPDGDRSGTTRKANVLPGWASP